MEKVAKHSLRYKGMVTITIRKGKDKGAIRLILDNVVTNVGKAQAAGLLNGIVTTPFKYIAIGDGSDSSPGSCSSEQATDTALGHELARKQGTTSRTTTSVTNDTAVVEATFSSDDGLTGTATLCESGLFDASTGGNMFARLTFPVINLDWDNGDSITIQWKVQVQ